MQRGDNHKGHCFYIIKCSGVFLVALALILFLEHCLYASAYGLEIIKNEHNVSYVVYDSKPAIAYGPSPQNLLTYLPRGDGNEVADWIHWAKQFGINNVRSYSPSRRVLEPAENVFLRSI